MKISILILILSGNLAWAQENKIQSETNIFVTVESAEVSKGARELVRKIEAASKANESRPAQQDPQGNWGIMAEGFQISLRFEKTVFKIGDSVGGIIIVRNATNSALVYTDFWGTGVDSSVCQFIVLDEKNNPVERIQKSERMSGSARGMELSPGTQRRYAVNFSGRFKLDVPGTYHIQVKKNVPKRAGEGYVEITSGVVVITVTP